MTCAGQGRSSLAGIETVLHIVATGTRVGVVEKRFVFQQAVGYLDRFPHVSTKAASNGRRHRGWRRPQTVGPRRSRRP